MTKIPFTSAICRYEPLLFELTVSVVVVKDMPLFRKTTKSNCNVDEIPAGLLWIQKSIGETPSVRVNLQVAKPDPPALEVVVPKTRQKPAVLANVVVVFITLNAV